jgi:hypothetical protein
MSQTRDRQEYLANLIAGCISEIAKWEAFRPEMSRRGKDGTFFDVRQTSIAYQQRLITIHESQLHRETSGMYN